MAVRPQGRDWVLLIFVGALACALAIGLGLVGAGAISMAGARSQRPVASGTATATATPTPTTTASATPTPSVVQPTNTPDPRHACAFGDFPVYPGSTRIGDPTANGRRWWVNTYPTQVADYYSAGTGPTEWLFRPEPVNGTPWRFRMTRPPACRGVLTIFADPSVGTQYEAIPDGD
jgi:hypothetical protein